jgi:2-polyprenyl-6-methoxyphenol hydroxylase-like FAD-dependent oxidoreductase
METPVLIIGAGPTGLALALQLARLGLRPLVVEKHPGTSLHPKATGISTRSMEFLRLWGLAEHVANPIVPFMSVSETLAAPELERRPLGHPDAAEAARVSPVAPALFPQDALEPLLLDAARAAGAEAWFGEEVVALRQDAAGVSATVRERESGVERHVRARYVVACDGASSPTRQRLGIPMAGADRLAAYASILFRADLSNLLGDRRFPLYAVTVGGEPAPWMVVPTGHPDRWILAVPVPPHDAEGALPDADARRALVRRALGADAPAELLDARTFTVGAQVAARFRDGRVFLAGDAAHRMTPSGSMGMNCSLHDAHNLAWKLAAVLRGWAGDVLLDSYERERRPVAERLVARSIGLRKDLTPFAADLGAVYVSGAVVVEPGPETTGPDDAARPGARVPHGWIERRGRRVSTVDLAEHAMLLLVGPDGDAWHDAARACPVPVDVVRCTCVEWRAFSGLDDGGALLLRPDGHVAWRAAAAEVRALGAVLDRVLGRTTALAAAA